MANKKIKKTDLSITLLLLLGIVAVVNFFSYQIFYRWDLTQGKEYSISSASKKTVEGLSDIVNVKAYFSANLPNQLYSLRQEVTDILDEYKNYSHGNLNVQFIDPGDDQQLQQELYIMGIPQLTFDVYAKDQRQMVNGYMGIAISYGDKTEVIPAVKHNTSDLEYQLTTAIKKVTSSKIATIGVLTSNGTADTQNRISAAYQALGKLYTVQNVDLSGDAPVIPDNVDTLLIVGPTEKFSEDQLKSIDEFVAKGKSLMVLLDGVTIGQGLSASANDTGLDGLLASYGIKFNRDLVLDKQSGVASFNQGYITFSTNYPYWPDVRSDGFAKDNSAVANLEDVVFPWASSIDLDQSKLGENANGSVLVHTTANAWRVTSNFNVNPQALPSPTSPKEYDLAVMVSGQLPGAYAATSSPEGEARAPDSRIVVVGDSDFVSDNFAQGSPDNLTMFQNLVDILSLDEDLINIRSKVVTSRPIKDLSDGGRAAVRYFNVFGLTIVVIIFGLLRYYMRRRSRFVDEI